MAWMMDTYLFGSPEEQPLRMFTMQDLPDFVSYLCSRSDELESEREDSRYFESRLAKIEPRLEIFRESLPAIASMLDDGGLYDIKARRRSEEMVEDMKARRKARAEAQSSSSL